MPEQRTYIITVNTRMAIVADSEEHALDCARQEFTMNSGSLSDMLIYEWDNPVSHGEEKKNV